MTKIKMLREVTLFESDGRPLVTLEKDGVYIIRKSLAAVWIKSNTAESA